MKSFLENNFNFCNLFLLFILPNTLYWKMIKLSQLFLTFFLTLIVSLGFLEPAWAFCGFYVSKADSNLYNQTSQVIIAREGDRTLLTMANDYQGEVKDFALVVPVPVVIKKEQVNIGDPQIINRLDSFSAPRLVEYFDANPCDIRAFDEAVPQPAPASASLEAGKVERNNALGVTIEEQFSVGEYDILILSAKESNGLETWLRQNGYQIPSGASTVLQPYIRQQMKFFVAKVNLKEYAKSDFQTLRPLMIAYESAKFMLPIRLGMVNAKGEQDLIVYLLSPQGQTELTNYRTVQIPSDVDIPEFVEPEFSKFYQAMFTHSYRQEGKKVAFVEYAWNMSNCDPCSAEPLSPEELRKAGVFWLNNADSQGRFVPNFQNVFITRLHIRYQRETFPEDLKFQATNNQQLFQGRYVLRRPYRGEMKCNAAQGYLESVKTRQEQEAQTLARLTGWNLRQILNKIDFVDVKPTTWWCRLWSCKGFQKYRNFQIR